MPGDPTGCMGLPDYLGWDWQSKGGIPIVCVPGCPALPDNMTETLLYLLFMAAGTAPMIPLDSELRPHWLFNQTVHEGSTAAGITSKANSPKFTGQRNASFNLAVLAGGSNCNVGKRGWMGGIGGCANVGGICIGCTMPGFPEKFMPFMTQPPGSMLSMAAV